MIANSVTSNKLFRALSYFLLSFLYPVENKPMGIFQTASEDGENRKECSRKYNGICTIASPYLKLSFAPTTVKQGFDLLLKSYFL